MWRPKPQASSQPSVVNRIHEYKHRRQLQQGQDLDVYPGSRPPTSAMAPDGMAPDGKQAMAPDGKQPSHICPITFPSPLQMCGPLQDRDPSASLLPIFVYVFAHCDGTSH